MLTDDFDLYYNFKFLECIIFVEYTHTEYGETFKDIEYLRQFQNFIEDNRLLFDDKRVNNIYKILQDVRYVEDEYKEERITILNNINNILNPPINQKDNYDFYRTEIVQRYNKKKYYRLKDDVVESKKDLISASIAFDMPVIESHIFDSEMYNKYYNEFIDNPLYYMSVRAIINEFPLILDNDIFVVRLNDILSQTKDTKTSKKLVKEIDRRIKR